MKNRSRTAIKIMLVLVAALTTNGAFPQRQLKDDITLETLAARALETFLKTSYKVGSGKPLSASGVNSFRTGNKISLSKLPDDIASDLRKGAVEGLLIPDVSNPGVPGTTGDVVIIRSKCLLSTPGCSHRGVLIPPPSFFGKGAEEEDWCTNCTGCEGAKNPPQCDLYDTCVCIDHPRSKGCNACKKCAGC